MPFVLPLTDQEAENARLLDRLTKQQEENQSLRVENAQLKDWATTAQAKADKLESELADYKRIAEQQEKTIRELRAEREKFRVECLDWQRKGCLEAMKSETEIDKLKAEINLYTNGMSLEEWHDDMEQQKAEITDDAERDIAQLGADLAMKDGIIDRLREAKYQLSIKHDAEIDKLKKEISGLGEIICQTADDRDKHEHRADELKKELLDINAKHHSDTQKTCLKAKFDTWREEQVKYNSGYSIEDEAEWLVNEAINIQDAVDVFNELYEDGCCGDESTYKLICDSERKWQLEQLYMDDEGEYTLTEEEWQAQNQ